MNEKIKTILKGKTMKMILFIAAGAVLGFLYYKVVGCKSGTCPITSSPIVSTIYGAAMGYLISGLK